MLLPTLEGIHNVEQTRDKPSKVATAWKTEAKNFIIFNGHCFYVSHQLFAYRFYLASNGPEQSPVIYC